jgi:hypothetical protein
MKLTGLRDFSIGPARLARMNISPSRFKTTVIDASETAYYLREKLGPLRAWTDFLTDVRREKNTQVAGHELIPCCRIRGRLGRWSPAYALEDVEEFVTNVLNDAQEAGSTKLVTADVIIAPAASWRALVNSFNKDGSRYVPPSGC